MKLVFKILPVSILFLIIFCKTNVTQNKVDVLVIGTIHAHHGISNYTYNDVLQVLNNYKPDKMFI